MKGSDLSKTVSEQEAAAAKSPPKAEPAVAAPVRPAPAAVAPLGEPAAAEILAGTPDAGRERPAGPDRRVRQPAAGKARLAADEAGLSRGRPAARRWWSKRVTRAAGASIASRSAPPRRPIPKCCASAWNGSGSAASWSACRGKRRSSGDRRARRYDEGQLPWLEAVEDEDEPRGVSARKMLAALARRTARRAARRRDLLLARPARAPRSPARPS